MGTERQAEASGAERQTEAFAAYLRMQGTEERYVPAYMKGLELMLGELGPEPSRADVDAWLEGKRADPGSERALANAERIAEAYLAFRAETGRPAATPRATGGPPPTSSGRTSPVVWYALVGAGFVLLLLAVLLAKPLGVVSTRMSTVELASYARDGSMRSFVVTGRIERDRDHFQAGVFEVYIPDNFAVVGPDGNELGEFEIDDGGGAATLWYDRSRIALPPDGSRVEARGSLEDIPVRAMLGPGSRSTVAILESVTLLEGPEQDP